MKILRTKLLARELMICGIALAAGSQSTALAGDAVAPAGTTAIDPSLGRATKFVLSAQAADGAWRATRYPALADGPSLTPLVLRSLHEQRQSKGARASWQKGIDYLATLPVSDSGVEPPPASFRYPFYTAAGAALVFADLPAYEKQSRFWLDFLARRQLAERLGWQASDEDYGGWSYARALPLKPPAAQPRSPLEVANLSATVFAVEALRHAGRPETDPSVVHALQFLLRCQNFAEGDGKSRFDDGGFFFVLGDATRNKAGIAGTDASGRVRFRSYPSATADGLRAMRWCGLATDHPRVRAARQWLKRSLGEIQVNDSLAAKSAWQTASFYYACWSLALSLDAFEPREAAIVAQALIARQSVDGSWSNPAIELREDEPLVATPLALEALEHCRRRVARP